MKANCSYPVSVNHLSFGSSRVNFAFCLIFILELEARDRQVYGGDDGDMDCGYHVEQNSACARSKELNDALAVSLRSLKCLASNIENELYSYYGGVTSQYKRKYHALVASFNDPKNLVFAFCTFH